ncbi:hypothetical protein [Streptacidiphilus sp. EB103A]|uniref:hypothetical protein n=1 Tax=Streptacidiphilus sp. EB103A TaxID=3156275 RepID=UPI003512DD15
MTKNPILIAAATFDEHAYGPVSRLLEARGYPVIVYKTDRVLGGQDRLVIGVKGGVLSADYEGVSILPEHLSAAWYRKIASFGLPDAGKQLAKQLYMNNEVRALHDTIWPQFYPEGVWLSSPAKLAKADRKLGQLLIAHEIGFEVPDTVVSSDWDAIAEALLPDGRARIIVKMMRGVISEGNTVKALPTTILDKMRVDEIKDATSPFPGLYQPYVEKAREWRVTVVGSEVFPAAIYTDAKAKDDWRKHQNGTGVQFRKGDLPEGIAELCIQYLEAMGLGFGAFDFIERPDGSIVFLECNANGQYGWLEEDLGLPISGAIAAELVRIAQQRG